MSPLPFYHVYPHSTRPKIAFILPEWMGDDNQNQIFAAGWKNCVFYRRAVQENLGRLSGQPGVRA